MHIQIQRKQVAMAYYIASLLIITVSLLANAASIGM